jgi:hypothetical protein
MRVWLLEAGGILEQPEVQEVVREAYGKLPRDAETAAAIDKFTSDVERLAERRAPDASSDAAVFSDG